MLDFKNQKGFAAFLIAILVLAVIFGIAISLTVLILGQEKISRNVTSSTQSYFTAEAGVEDALLKLAKKMKWSSPYSLNIGSSSASVEISNIIGGSRTITSNGNFSNRIRKVQVVYQISTDKVSFYYGAQVGDGGMVMGNGSAVQGNVFSNGSVIGGGTIANSIIVARDGNRIEGLTVGENATVHTCKDSTIGGTLTYVSGGSVLNCRCIAGSCIDSQPNEIEPEDLPIPLSQINEWKTQAAASGIINSDVTYSGITSAGPIQIGTPASPKNLTVAGGAILTVKGTIYVTGDIIFSNGAIIKLDNSYNSFSGVILADGKITTNNGVVLQGSGQPGSYIMILSSNNSLDPASPAINVRNNAVGAIFYTTSGLIYLKNNMVAREITGYKVQIENNAVVQYESGLQDANFTSGTGGSWEVAGWKEIE
jgi:Tfp pilus assembly protein PilX